MKNIAYCFILACFVGFSCSNPTTKDSSKCCANKNDSTCTKNKKDSCASVEMITVNKQLNDVALFIAGLPVDSVSELYTLSKTEAWKKYQSDVDAAWTKFYAISDKIKEWKNKEIAKTNDTIQTLFYPFGGPDYLFANIFFPNAKNYILIGLENAGNIPVLKSAKKDSLKGILSLYKTAIEDVIQLSFFRTLDMNHELKTQTIDGTAPIIMLFLARSGKQLVSVTPMNLDENGKFEPNTSGKSGHIAIDLAFITPGDNTLRHIYYLSTNLADPSLSKDKAFMAFLNNIDDKSYSFVKSATYLMHKNYFSIIRNTVLDKSVLVLQDASGIAYKFFDKSKWDIQLYGVYENPIPLFKDFYEADLSEAYKKGAKAITFRYGYNRKSSMLLAEKN